MNAVSISATPRLTLKGEFEDLGGLAVEARKHLLAILLRTSERAGAWLI